MITITGHVVKSNMVNVLLSMLLSACLENLAREQVGRPMVYPIDTIVLHIWLVSHSTAGKILCCMSEFERDNKVRDQSENGC